MTAGTIADRLTAGAPVAGEASPRPVASGRQSARSVSAFGRLSRWLLDVARTIWADIRSSWWTPASLPTLQQAWTERIPDRDAVPAANWPMWAGWVVYNHTLRLALTALVLAGVGVFNVFGFVVQHPARLALFTIVATATAALILH